MDTPELEPVPVAEARKNLSKLVNRLLVLADLGVFDAWITLTRRDDQVAVLAPLKSLDLLAAAQAAGGLERAIELLKQHAAASEAAGAPSEK